jgi:4-amino-4-deoxychorismate mutase
MAPHGHADDIQQLREALDDIDAELLQLLNARFAACMRIAHYKREHAVPLMQPDRIRVVHSRAERFAADRGLSADFMHKLYDLIIAEACRLEAKILGDEEPART